MREPLPKTVCLDLSAVHGPRKQPFAHGPRNRSFVREPRG